MTDAAATPETTRLLSWLPPRHVLIKALPIAVVLLLPVGVAGWLGGLGIAIVAMLSLAIALAQAPSTRGATQSLFVLAIAIVAAVGAVARGHSGAIVVVVVLASLLVYPGDRASAGLLSMAPVLVVLEGLGVVKVGWVAAFFASFLAGVYVVLIVRLRRMRIQAHPVPRKFAAWHAVQLAILCGVTAALVNLYDLPHGYWIIVTLAAVLRPSIRESSKVARDRVIGAVAGSLIAVVVGVALPDAAIWVVVVVFFWLALGYLMAHRTIGAAVSTTVLIIILVAPSVAGGTWTAAGQRIAWTMVGALIAVLAGLTLRGADQPASDAVVQG